MNKKVIGNYARYKASTARDLYGAYTTPSYKKRRAWEYCRETCAAAGGHDLRVVSWNTFVFTAGFTFTDADGVPTFCYITPSGTTCAPLE